jgi:hypothetical protein
VCLLPCSEGVEAEEATREIIVLLLLIAACLLARQAPGGLDLLYHELSSTQGAGGSTSAAAYAFLATCVKDHGAVDAAISLLSKVGHTLPGAGIDVSYRG